MNYILSVVITGVIVVGGTLSQVRSVSESQNVRWFSVSDLSLDAGAQPQLIGARIVNPKMYPSSFYSKHGTSMCTSTLVGPRVLLTAAHCMPPGGKAQITRGGREFVAACTHAPEYNGGANPTADWALCLFASAIPTTPETPFEVLNTDPKLIAKDKELLLTGFGCTNPSGGGGNDGHYRVGEAVIEAVPAGDNYDIVTRGKAALCFGDSGGPAFWQEAGDGSRRVQVSVNSRGNIFDRSYLSSVTAPPAVSFLKSWSATHGVQICGIDPATPGCRR